MKIKKIKKERSYKANKTFSLKSRNLIENLFFLGEMLNLSTFFFFFRKTWAEGARRICVGSPAEMEADTYVIYNQFVLFS